MHRGDIDVEGTHRVRSADEVVLDIPLAGPTSRILAYAVDAVLMFVVEAAVIVGAVVFGAITTGGIRRGLRALTDAVGSRATAGSVSLDSSSSSSCSSS